MKNLKILLYTLAGLLMGVGIGVLIAPSAGRETRSRLTGSVNKLRKNFGMEEDEFSDSEMEMDARSGRSYDF
jgi:gas vesicle protein